MVGSLQFCEGFGLGCLVCQCEQIPDLAAQSLLVVVVEKGMS
jgi:hypothetical protein